jgi:hypothetical protein
VVPTSNGDVAVHLALRAVAITDVDADGKADIAVSAGGLNVLLNTSP